MINELTPGGQEDGDGVIVIAQVTVIVGRHVAGGGQFLARDGHARVADSVGKGGRKQPPEGGQRGAPVRILQVVAHAVVLAETLDAARRFLEVGRAEAVDDGLAGVNQRQSGVDGVARQSVPVPFKSQIINHVLQPAITLPDINHFPLSKQLSPSVQSAESMSREEVE